MCGLNGLVRLEESATLDLAELERTSAALAPRGPDGSGTWADPQGRYAVAHRRLAIIELSDLGAQPMASADGRFVLAFNGVIYNHHELGQELEREGVSLRGGSDTEVLVEMWSRFGAACLERLRGMYALALWDTTEGSLTLVRDPYGIKPLYYATGGGVLRFASQVRALEAGGATSGDVDLGGLVGFLRWGFVPEPRTLRKAIRAVPAGCCLEVRHGVVQTPRRFHLPRVDRSGEPLPEALEDSVRHHLVADRRVAVFLSAGVDSALVAALASRGGARPTTLTLRFEEFEGSAQDEAPLAREVARHLGTEHVEHTVTEAEFRSVEEAFRAAMDQPTMDGLNTFLISRIAHQHGYRVALSGLGGDELFGGYPAFTDVPQWHRAARWARFVPGAASIWRRVGHLASPSPKAPEVLQKARTLGGAYELRRGLFVDSEIEALLGADQLLAGLDAMAEEDVVTSALGEWKPPPRSDDPWLCVQRLESLVYMRNQLLRDADWASMASALELRVPLVDVVLWQQLAALGFEPGRSRGKAAVLREIAPGLPSRIYSRPKTGFVTPQGRWQSEGARLGSWGQASRRIALDVLPRFGVDLPTAQEAGLR